MTYPVGPVSGRLQTDGTLRGRLSSQGGLSGGLSIGTTSAFPAYEGPYEVTPTLEMQALGTQGKLMQHNVTVHEIPVTRTSNPYDGITVLIG